MHASSQFVDSDAKGFRVGLQIEHGFEPFFLDLAREMLFSNANALEMEWQSGRPTVRTLWTLSI